VQSSLPRGSNEWVTIADRYNQATGEGRNSAALKQKFYRMVQKKKKTGETEIPIHIRCALQVISRNGGTSNVQNTKTSSCIRCSIPPVLGNIGTRNVLASEILHETNEQDSRSRLR
jgi:hypothetical protein